MQLLFTAVLALLGIAPSAASPADFKSKCEALANGVQVPGYSAIKVNMAAYMTQNTAIDKFAEGTNVTCAYPRPTVQVNLCRVALTFPTSESSEVYMEAWLPEKWNERFLAVGTGGLGGCIFYHELAFQTQYGYATVSTNSGHNGTSAGAFMDQPQVLEDFVFRAVYATTQVGKKVARELYGRRHKKAYWIGCSQGGRHGFQAAQEYPGLFDGIVVGAPGLRLPGVFQHFTRWLLEMGTDSNNLTVSLDKWSAIQKETLRQCDALDGAMDGIIEDTRHCHPDLTVLQCGASASSPCLTPTDLSLITQFFSPWTINNTLIYPGMTHTGTEFRRASALSSSPEPLVFAHEWPRYVIYNDTTWTLDRWTSSTALLAAQQNPFGINAWNGNLSPARDRGVKIVHYHGLVDPFLDAGNSDAYYELVRESLQASYAQIDRFYRYFRVSGLGHCAGGNGAWSVGQGADAQGDNVLARVVEWVEEGKAPERLRGVKFVDDDVGKGVEFARRHCRYPYRNVYVGEEGGGDEEAWRCVE